MFFGKFHLLLRACSMDMPRKKLGNPTDRNTTWGVFRAYAFFFLKTKFTELFFLNRSKAVYKLFKIVIILRNWKTHFTCNLIVPQFRMSLYNTYTSVWNRIM